MSSRTVLVSNTVFDAARCMRDLRATALAVQAHDGSLRGIISEQDLIKRCFLKGLDAHSTSVEDVMTRGVEFVTEAEAKRDIGAVQKRLAELGIKHMPVIADEPDEAGVRRVVGCLDILTVSSLVRDQAVDTLVRASRPGGKAAPGLVPRPVSSRPSRWLADPAPLRAAGAGAANGLPLWRRTGAFVTKHRANVSPLSFGRSQGVVGRLGHRLVSSLGAMLGIQAAKADAATDAAAEAAAASSGDASAASGSPGDGASALLMPHDTPVVDVARRMAEAASTAVVMHDPSSRATITGIVTARDVVTKLLAASSPGVTTNTLGREPAFLRVMTFDPVMAVEGSAGLASVLDEMQRRRFR